MSATGRIRRLGEQVGAIAEMVKAGYVQYVGLSRYNEQAMRTLDSER